MAVDTTHEYSLATDDEDAGGLHAWQEGTYENAEDEEDEEEDYHEEEDYYDFPETENDGPWYDPGEKEHP